jgi:transposase
MPQLSLVLRERAIGMLTAGMSTRAVAREFNVNFPTISRLQCHFREFVSKYNRSHIRKPNVTMPAKDLQLRNCLRQAIRTADETVSLHNQRISAQTVRNRLREVHLRARLYQGLDLTAGFN